MYNILLDEDLVELYNNLCKLYPDSVYKEYPTDRAYTPNSTKDLVTDIHNYFINNDKLKFFKKIKTAFLKKTKNKNEVYKRICKDTLINKIKITNLDIKLFKKLEMKYFSNNKFIQIRNILQIGKNNFIGNNNVVYGGDRNADR